MVPAKRLPEEDLRINGVWVIESLRPADMRTGTELHDAILVPFTDKHKNLKVFLSTPRTKAQLFELLARIRRECEKGLTPILHFEVHGSCEGLELTSGELVGWQELKSAFIEINIATKFNLLVVLAACDGAHLVSILRPNDRAPMWAVIGPTADIFPDQLLAGYSAFYNALLTSLKGFEALRVLNASLTGRTQYAFYTAEYMFSRVYEYYKRTEGKELRIRQRAKTIAKEVRKKHRVSMRSLKGFRKMAKKKLRNYKESFRPFAVTFFMHDLIPSMKVRYPIDAVL